MFMSALQKRRRDSLIGPNEQIETQGLGNARLRQGAPGHLRQSRMLVVGRLKDASRIHNRTTA